MNQAERRRAAKAQIRTLLRRGTARKTIVERIMGDPALEDEDGAPPSKESVYRWIRSLVDSGADLVDDDVLETTRPHTREEHRRAAIERYSAEIQRLQSLVRDLVAEEESIEALVSAGDEVTGHRLAADVRDERRRTSEVLRRWEERLAKVVDLDSTPLEATLSDEACRERVVDAVCRGASVFSTVHLGRLVDALSAALAERTSDAPEIEPDDDCPEWL